MRAIVFSYHNGHLVADSSAYRRPAVATGFGLIIGIQVISCNAPYGHWGELNNLACVNSIYNRIFELVVLWLPMVNGGKKGEVTC